MKFLSLIALLVVSSPVFATKADNSKIPRTLATRLVENYTQIAYAVYSDALEDAKSLEKSIHELIKAPSEETLMGAKEAWKKARISYSTSEVFRFYGSPIDHPEDGPEGLLNAWPMDEAYVDYVQGQATAGIINNPKEFPKINKALLLSLNEKNGEKNISTGYHAIEFLLWGQDLSLKSAGMRPASDFEKGKGPHAERRAEYLKLLAQILVGHLSDVQSQWKPGQKGSYADLLKSEALDESLRKIYTGVIGLSIDEMAGERLTVPLEMNDQENEQSCFSDTTLADANSNELGIRAVYYGTYKNIQGPGLHALAEATDAKLAQKSQERVEAATKQVAALAAKPLDVILASTKKKDADRKAVEELIVAFEEQARSIAAHGLKLGLVLNIQ